MVIVVRSFVLGMDDDFKTKKPICNEKINLCIQKQEQEHEQKIENRWRRKLKNNNNNNNKKRGSPSIKKKKDSEPMAVRVGLS